MAAFEAGFHNLAQIIPVDAVGRTKPPVVRNEPARPAVPFVAAVVAAWVVYVAAVTKYSEGEDLDPERRRRVGLLVGGIVYMQLAALIAFTMFKPTLKPLLVAGAVLLVLLRVMRRAFPKVSAS